MNEIKNKIERMLIDNNITKEYRVTIDDFWADEDTEEENILFVIQNFMAKVNELTQEVKESKVEEWQMIDLPIHGLSVNYLYEPRIGWCPVNGTDRDINGNVGLQNTKAHDEWLVRWNKFIVPILKRQSTYDKWLSRGVDLTKPIEIKIGYRCRRDMDILNLDKAWIDELFKFIREDLIDNGREDIAKQIDDVNISRAIIERVCNCKYFIDTNNPTGDYNNGGHIYFYMRNI